jgi:signal transduction histidine kinase
MANHFQNRRVLGRIKTRFLPLIARNSIAQRPTSVAEEFRVTETAGHIVSETAGPSEPEEGSTGRAPSTLALLLSWRDWNIPTKLAAVTLVPVVFAIVLGAMQISDEVDRAESYRQVDRLVTVNAQLRPLADALQRERTASTALLAARASGEAPTGGLGDEQGAVDGRTDALLRAANRATFHNEITASRFTEVRDRLAELPAIRQAIATGGLDAPATLGKFSAVIGALFTFDRAAAAEVVDPGLAGTAAALHDLELAKEEIRYQQALVGIGLSRGGLTDAELDELRASRGRLADRAAEFRLDATPAQQRDFQRLVVGPGADAREELATAAASAVAGRPVPVDAAGWTARSEDTATRTGAMSALLVTQLGDRSTALRNEASDGAGLAAVILLIALVVAAAVMLVVGRHLLRSLNQLLRSALDVAEYELPEAVERIRDGVSDHEPVIEPVPVRSADEVGQVARAFDAVHRQAIRLATEQANLRAHYGDVFVNLSRRSQGLVQRQLQLLERLERDEEDAEQLDTLFQLDHLATRMRRNNENLMVLSGGELGRRNQRPATLSDLMRAAVSEIEQYQRVVMLPPPAVLIVGYAVGDLVRLVAELLDNATVFSAPSTQVTIASHAFEDGSVCIAVLDEGIGMSESELAEANTKLANAHTVDVSTSRRMGLFVVGRLASRHQVEVSLHGGGDLPGVRATITVPAELVTGTVTEAQTELLGAVLPPAAANGQVNGANNGHVNGWRPSPLPRRVKPLNGRPAPEITTLPPAETNGSKQPLPRRSPGASQFAGPPDTATGPATTGVPGERPTSPADGLFTPPPERLPAVAETTPIFDEMASAWFRSLSESDHAWEFASDVGFHTARAVSTCQPDTFTDTGLPKRNPRQNLVPGSAGSGAAEPAATHVPEELRKRLSDYRQGVSRARDERLVDDDAEADDDPPTVDLGAAGWRFVPDPPDATGGGLPRRTRRANPVGGDGAVAVPDHHAADLRGRLGDLQAGLSRGRQSVAQRAVDDRVTEVSLGAQDKQVKHERETE